MRCPNHGRKHLIFENKNSLIGGRIALVGGGEFTSSAEPMDKVLLKDTGITNPSVIIIPTAAAHKNPYKAALNGVNHFSRLGANAIAIHILNSADSNDSQLTAHIDTADLIYLTGGDPLHLLTSLKNSLFLKKIRKAVDRGAILAGSSAGAMVLGSSMMYQRWRRALGFIQSTVILPHHEKSNPGQISKELRTSGPDRVRILGIESMTCCFINKEYWQVIGSGNVTSYCRDSWCQFTSGETIVFPPKYH